MSMGGRTVGPFQSWRLPAVAPGKLTEMRRKVSAWRIDRRTTLNLKDIAGPVNQVMQGWLAYFTVF